MNVYVWRDRHVSDQHAGGWVVGEFAAAVDSAADLRAVCEAAGVQRPSRPQRARATDDVVQIALAHPGSLLFLDPKPRSGEDPHWRVVSAGRG